LHGIFFSATVHAAAGMNSQLVRPPRVHCSGPMRLVARHFFQRSCPRARGHVFAARRSLPRFVRPYTRLVAQYFLQRGCPRDCGHDFAARSRYTPVWTP